MGPSLATAAGRNPKCCAEGATLKELAQSPGYDFPPVEGSGVGRPKGFLFDWYKQLEINLKFIIIRRIDLYRYNY